MWYAAFFVWGVIFGARVWGPFEQWMLKHSEELGLWIVKQYNQRKPWR